MNIEQFRREGANGFTLFIRLTPKAARNTIQGVSEQADGKLYLNIQISAVPENGKANKALLKFLAKTLKLPISAIELSRGHTSRFKQLELRGEPQELRAKLAALCA